MKLEEMKELIQALSESDVDKFEYKDDDFSVKLSKKKERVESEFEGTVVSIPVHNGDIVEYGEPLVIIR